MADSTIIARNTDPFVGGWPHYGIALKHDQSATVENVAIIVSRAAIDFHDLARVAPALYNQFI